jgi:hypothetical protein
MWEKQLAEQRFEIEICSHEEVGRKSGLFSFSRPAGFPDRPRRPA